MSLSSEGPGEDSAPGAEAAQPRIGDIVGSYRLVRLLGEGAAGRVFEVAHLTIGRRAAMKILNPEHAARPGAVRRLFNEARAVNEIDHPRIVTVTDLIEADTPGGVNAIVMELLEGESLRQAMTTDAPMPPVRYLPILAQVADALAAAHAARFVHRDLKPENIFLTTVPGQADHVKLLDFGLVKTVSEAAIDFDGVTAVFRRSSLLGPSWQHATAEGAFVGTPAYVSPEQAAGKPLDHRTDIYSLGIILYELLCGRLPFHGRNFGEYVLKHLTEPPPPAPPEVLATPLGRTLDAVARRCLAKRPADRFESAGELRELLERLALGELTDPQPAAAPPAPGGRPAVVALVAALVAGVAGLWWTTRAPRPQPDSVPPALAATAAAPAATGTAAPAAGGGFSTNPGADPAAASRGPTVVPFVPERTVELRFESTPPGAQIYRVGRPTLLGLTPFNLEVLATGATVEYEMRLPGHAPRRDQVVLDPDAPLQTVGGKLRRLPGPRPPRRAPAAPQTSDKPNRDGTLNPFAR